MGIPIPTMMSPIFWVTVLEAALNMVIEKSGLFEAGSRSGKRAALKRKTRADMVQQLLINAYNGFFFAIAFGIFMMEMMLTRGTSHKMGYSPKCCSEAGTKRSDQNVTITNSVTNI